MKRDSHFSPSVFVASAILMLVVPLGCSPERDGPPRYGLEGKVTLDGTSVRSGMLTLSPDVRKGNSGPGTIIMIVDGEYAVGADRGFIGGSHLVQFSIYAVGETSGENDDVEAVDEDEIEAYITTVEVDLPKKGGTYDFELSSAPKR